MDRDECVRLGVRFGLWKPCTLVPPERWER